MRWLEARPQLRPLILAVLTAILLLGGAAYMARTGGPSTAKPAHPTETSTSSVQANPTPIEASATPGSIQGPPVPSTSTREADLAFQTAKVSATAFLEAYASYRWDDTPQVVRARLRAYDTDNLDAALGSDSGGGIVGAAQAQSHEVASGHVVEMGPMVLDAGKLRVIATVREDITNDRGSASRVMTVIVLMAQTPAGWRADRVGA